MLCGLSVVLLFVVVNEYFVADAFVVNYKSVDMISSSIIRKSSIERRIPSHLYAEEEKNDKSFLDAMQPWKIDVPEEYREEILRAEGNTQVAKDRNTRVAIYLTITFVCVSIAIVNAFLTTLRQDDPNAISDLGWDWVQSNFLFSFLFTNGIGGAIALVLAGVCGTTAELEVSHFFRNTRTHIHTYIHTSPFPLINQCFYSLSFSFYSMMDGMMKHYYYFHYFYCYCCYCYYSNVLVMIMQNVYGKSYKDERNHLNQRRRKRKKKKIKRV